MAPQPLRSLTIALSTSRLLGLGSPPLLNTTAAAAAKVQRLLLCLRWWGRGLFVALALALVLALT